jgi:hypothetical protein
LPQAQAVALGGGASVFLLGEALFRRTLSIDGRPARALASILALATIPLGDYVSAAAQLIVLVALFVAMLLYGGRRPHPRSAAGR